MADSEHDQVAEDEGPDAGEAHSVAEEHGSQRDVAHRANEGEERGERADEALQQDLPNRCATLVQPSGLLMSRVQSTGPRRRRTTSKVSKMPPTYSPTTNCQIGKIPMTMLSSSKRPEGHPKQAKSRCRGRMP